MCAIYPCCAMLCCELNTDHIDVAASRSGRAYLSRYIWPAESEIMQSPVHRRQRSQGTKGSRGNLAACCECAQGPCQSMPAYSRQQQWGYLMQVQSMVCSNHTNLMQDPSGGSTPMNVHAVGTQEYVTVHINVRPLFMRTYVKRTFVSEICTRAELNQTDLEHADELMGWLFNFTDWSGICLLREQKTRATHYDHAWPVKLCGTTQVW